MVTKILKWDDFKANVDAKNGVALVQWFLESERYTILFIDGNLILECCFDQDSTEGIDFEANYKSATNKAFDNRDAEGNIITKNKAFADKTGTFYRGKGVKDTVLANSTKDLTLIITYPKAKINGLELHYGSKYDEAEFLVFDDANGTYSGVPNAQLNQFGYSWNVKAEYHQKILPYDADLYYGMKIVVRYTNNQGTDEIIGVNFDIHQTS